MMIRAYQEIYLNSAQAMLGDAFDYAINICHYTGEDFVKMFVVSPISKRIENGEPTYLKGKSGIEVLIDIVYETTGKIINVSPIERFSRSPEYWIGWALAYYQWYSCRSFGEILQVISFTDLQNMYYTLHEADISKFADVLDMRMREHFVDTRLKHYRAINSMSQSELAKASGVSLRSIQMYEQRNKDINKASAETILRLSKALSCSMEDLLEV
ncbi:MAG: helix-turn-helix transcriptional regulator [Phascolarctobacterium sp.]|nr:helix-turn-helix transcriptional regulator [Phascolarctobacterium sp.]